MSKLTSRLGIELKSRKTVIAAIVSITIISATVIGVIYYFNIPSNEYELNIKDNNPAEIGVDEWLEDFNALYLYVRDNYPYLTLKERTHGYNWLDLRVRYENLIKAASDNAEFFSIITDAVEALQNRHTNIVDPDYYSLYQSSYGSWLPICEEVFNDDVVSASSYWESIYNEYYYNRTNISYDAKIVYDRGVYRIVDGYGSWLEKYGNQSTILQVNGTPIDNAVVECFDRAYLDWDFAREKLYLWMVTPHEFGNTVFTIKNVSGYEYDVSFDIVNNSYENPFNYPTTLSSPLIFNTWENQSVAYIYFRSFSYYLEPYLQDILDFLNQIEDYQHLIIDIRGNEGGSSSNWFKYLVGPLINETKPLIRYLAYPNGKYVNTFRKQIHDYITQNWGISSGVIPADFEPLAPEVSDKGYKIYDFSYNLEPINEVDFNGTINLLIDNIAFSASENLAIFCKEHDFATIYGIPSGGDGIIPTPIFFTLPNSKIVIRAAPAIGLENNGEANEESRTLPDVHYESSFGNFSELIEFVIEDITS
ncbi:MAG: S41 family peptidase [Promethearchaeota archaeon]|jgi:hypothetical protein